MVENEKSELLKAVADMSQFAGALAGAAVVAGKKLIDYINKLTIAESVKQSSGEKHKSKAKAAK